MIEINIFTTCPHCGGNIAVIRGVQECLDCFWTEETLIRDVRVDERCAVVWPFIQE